MNFDWEHVKSLGITPASQFKNGLPPPQISTSAKDLFIGKLPFVKDQMLCLMMDGMLFNSITNTTEFKIKAISDPNLLKNQNLVLKLDSNDYQFLELDQMLNTNELSMLQHWVTGSRKLISIANDYEKNRRQFYHFLYDMVALVKATSRLPIEYQKLLIETVDGSDKLMHNRILAELASVYITNHVIKIEPRIKSSSRKPDLSVDGILADVKSVLISGTNDRESISDFAHKLKKDIDDKEKIKQQTGQEGSLFIAPWSGIVNSIFYTFFNSMKVEGKHNFSGAKFFDSVPILNKKQTVFVLPSEKAFNNGYLVFDTKWVSDIIEDFVEQGYPLISKFDPLSYLCRTNIREGCPFGIMGVNPSFVFHVR